MSQILLGIGGWGIGDWGLGIGDWGLGIGRNSQYAIPNALTPNPNQEHYTTKKLNK